MSQYIDEDLIIKDIDSPLHKYFYFYRIDIKNSFLSDRQKFVQKIKSNILNIYLFICVIYYGILSLIIQNKRVPQYYFDFIQYFGEYPEFYYLCAIFGSIHGFRVLHIFNHSNSNDYEWLKIIKVLNGLQSLDSLKIHNKNEIQEYIQKIKSFKFFVYISAYLTYILNFFTTLTVLYLSFDSSDLIRFGIFSTFIYLIFCYSLTTVIIFSFLYYFIVCFYCKTIFKSFNYSIKQLFDGKALLKYKTIDQRSQQYLFGY
jgi:hypothetical protein